MKVITAHIPIEDLDEIEALVGKEGFYASRSEALREAIKAFLIRRMQLIREIETRESDSEIEKLKQKCKREGKVMVPTESNSMKKEDTKPEKQFEIYKVLRKLEF
jgi:Arc/MetJ-type ribon-helix-helix transcriptional regulator